MQMKIGERISEKKLKEKKWEFKNNFGYSGKIYGKGKKRILYNTETKEIELIYTIK